MTEEAKTVTDAAAVISGLGSWLALLPDIAALFTVIWPGLRIAIAIKELKRRD